MAARRARVRVKKQVWGRGRTGWATGLWLLLWHTGLVRGFTFADAHLLEILLGEGEEHIPLDPMLHEELHVFAQVHRLEHL